MNKINRNNKVSQINWGNYKRIAQRLNEVHSNMDVMMLHRDTLINLITGLPDFSTLEGKPDQYTLDDIRFEWFFLKKGYGDNKDGRVNAAVSETG